MNKRSRSTLFLIEQLIVIAVFAICSTACVKILTSAYVAARESKDVTNAISVAESGAECFKAVNGDVNKASEMLGGFTGITDNINEAVIYYDKQWQVCKRNDAAYIFYLIKGKPETQSTSLIMGEIYVGKITGECLMNLQVAAGGRETIDKNQKHLSSGSFFTLLR
jgi:hypothetical protein